MSVGGDCAVEATGGRQLVRVRIQSEFTQIDCRKVQGVVLGAESRQIREISSHVTEAPAARLGLRRQEETAGALP